MFKQIKMMQSDTSWEISRKSFVRTLILSGAALQLPWLTSCSSDDVLPSDVTPLNLSQFKTVRALQNTLFPSDGNGPGAADLSADVYFLWVLRDPELDPDETNYLIEKLKKFEAFCLKQTGESFPDLSTSEQNEVVALAATYIWGDRWLSRMLTIIFEALLVDPKYGVNTNESGWKWLNHDPGNPRPDKNHLYPKILSLSHEV